MQSSGMTEDAVRVPTRERINITALLKGLVIGATVRFPLGTNLGSIRTIATGNEIRISVRTLDSGEIEVTRRPDKTRKQRVQQKDYDL